MSSHHWFTADRERQSEGETHIHNIGALVYKCHIDTSVSVLGVWSRLSCGWLVFVFQQASSWVNKNETIYGNKPRQHTCSTNMQILKSPECDLIQISSIRYHSTMWWASKWLLGCLRELRDWMNELKLSPVLPLGPQVISWSNVTFAESETCVCVCCCFKTQWGTPEVTWGLLWGQSSLPFINGWGHSHYTVIYLLSAMKSMCKHHRDMVVIKTVGSNYRYPM